MKLYMAIALAILLTFGGHGGSRVPGRGWHGGIRTPGLTILR